MVPEQIDERVTSWPPTIDLGIDRAGLNSYMRIHANALYNPLPDKHLPRPAGNPQGSDGEAPVSISHFVTHMDEVIEHEAAGSYSGKRIVNFDAGACGYGHAIDITLPPGTRVLAHWHNDREAIFYCVSGSGYFVLDEIERKVGPGDVMFQPLKAVHSLVATKSEPFEFLDFALFSNRRSAIDLKDCFTSLKEAESIQTDYGESRPFFPSTTYGNPAIRWVGERWLRPGGDWNDAQVDPGSEQVCLLLEGQGEIRLAGEALPLSKGSIMYLIRDLPFTIRNTGRERMRIVGTSSMEGRLEEPPLFERMREAAARAVARR